LAKQVSVSPIGVSNVLRITIRDRSAQVATTLTNALASAVVQVRQQTSSAGLGLTIADLNKRLADLNQQLGEADKAVDQANAALGNASSTSQLAAASSAATAARSRRDNIATEVSSAQTQLAGLQNTLGGRPIPQVVDPAITPRSPDPSTLPQDLALAGLAGLIVGLGLAALIEAMRPTVVGSRALARRLGAPVLEELPCCPDHLEGVDTDLVAGRVNLAAKGAGVSLVELIAVSGKPVSGLAERLGAGGPAPARDPQTWAGSAPERLAIGNGHSAVAPYGRPTGMNNPANGGAAAWVASSAAVTTSGRSPWVSQPEPVSGPVPVGGPSSGLAPLSDRAILQTMDPGDPAVLSRLGEHTGLVIVTPAVVKWRDLEPVADLVAISRSPLLGLITYRRGRPHEGPPRPSRSTPAQHVRSSPVGMSR
jgi:capsular polysaccharide biosynthesis protein